MCSFSEGWRTELPCSSLSLTRKDDVVLAELWAKIAAASVKERAVLLLDFWALSRRQMLRFVIYKINHRAAFCWKAPSYLGRKKIGRKRRRKTWRAGKNKDRAQIQLEESVLSCRSASPHCLGFILPFVIFSGDGAMCLQSLWARAGRQRGAAAALRREKDDSFFYRKPGRAVAAFAAIALVPAITRLKFSCLGDDAWEWSQPKARGFQYGGVWLGTQHRVQTTCSAVVKSSSCLEFALEYVFQHPKTAALGFPFLPALLPGWAPGKAHVFASNYRALRGQT